MLSVTARKQFGDFTLDATWSSDQAIVALVGPSGSGKTLTLQCIAGLIAPDSAASFLAGARFSTAARASTFGRSSAASDTCSRVTRSFLI